MSQKALIVIPARMASSRFPAKPLAVIKGLTMLERVWKIGMASKFEADVIIATDDSAIYEKAKSFGADVMMTSKNCLTGSDRVAEVAKTKSEYDIVFSLQGDAVLTPPWVIDAVLETMMYDVNIPIATPAVALKGQALDKFVERKRNHDVSGTCVVFNDENYAMYFSSALIPFVRNNDYSNIYQHIGLYGYRRKTLLEFNQLPETKLEKIEKLEQLRALENRIPIKIVEVDYQGRTHGSVDHPKDVAIVEDIIEREGELFDE